MMRVKILLVSLVLLIAVQTHAQVDVDEKADWTERFYFGGGGGFNGGNANGLRYFSFSVSPIAGYMVTSNFSVGTGVVYQRTSYPDVDFNYTQYGLMPFARYNFNDLFLTTEYNLINLPAVNFNGNSFSANDRITRSRFLVGAGYSQPIGGRARLNVAALYDVMYQRPSVFLSPWVFRMFFSF